MPVVSASVVIRATPEAVSEVLLDIDAAPLWTSGLERLELVEGGAGRPGTVGLAHYVERGRSYTLEDHLLESEPGRHFKSEVTGGGLRATVATDLETVPGGTRVTVRWAGTGTNPITRVMLPFLRRSVRQRCHADLEALRDLVEDRGTAN